MPGRLGTVQNFPSEVLCVLTKLGELREHAFPITLADLRAGAGETREHGDHRVR